MKMIPGFLLTPTDVRRAKSLFCYRHTRDHKPRWSVAVRKNGRPYPVQFASDQEWLDNTTFAVNADGRLSLTARACESKPTWPDNPELRKI